MSCNKVNVRKIPNETAKSKRSGCILLWNFKEAMSAVEGVKYHREAAFILQVLFLNQAKQRPGLLAIKLKTLGK